MFYSIIATIGLSALFLFLVYLALKSILEPDYTKVREAAVRQWRVEGVMNTSEQAQQQAWEAVGKPYKIRVGVIFGIIMMGLLCAMGIVAVW